MFKVCWGALLYFKQRVLTTSKYDDHYMCHGQKSSCMGFSWVVVIYPMGILTMGIHPHEWIEDHPPGAQAQHGSTINRDPKWLSPKPEWFAVHSTNYSKVINLIKPTVIRGYSQFYQKQVGINHPKLGGCSIGFYYITHVQTKKNKCSCFQHPNIISGWAYLGSSNPMADGPFQYSIRRTHIPSTIFDPSSRLLGFSLRRRRCRLLLLAPQLRRTWTWWKFLGVRMDFQRGLFTDLWEDLLIYI